jgi:hypothetical protein
VGVLVGLEVPLLLRLLRERLAFSELVARVLSLDYLGPVPGLWDGTGTWRTLGNSGWKLDEINAKRLALIFAISNGGVIYTKRFYHDIVESGARTASPLLFPETVFNAPASHLAAILGITGASYTLVGDAAVGILALKMAEDLIKSGHGRSLSRHRCGRNRLAALRRLSEMALAAFRATNRSLRHSGKRDDPQRRRRRNFALA